MISGNDQSEKVCRVCSVLKPLEAFYLASKSRRERQCKACRLLQMKRLHSEHTDHVKARLRRASKRAAEKDHKKVLARAKVACALKMGKIIPWPCIVCGLNAEAHHPDYDSPLDVVWLCRQHHQDAHSIVRQR